MGLVGDAEPSRVCSSPGEVDYNLRRLRAGPRGGVGSDSIENGSAHYWTCGFGYAGPRPDRSNSTGRYFTRSQMDFSMLGLASGPASITSSKRFLSAPTTRFGNL